MLESVLLPALCPVFSFFPLPPSLPPFLPFSFPPPLLSRFLLPSLFLPLPYFRWADKAKIKCGEARVALTGDLNGDRAAQALITAPRSICGTRAEPGGQQHHGIGRHGRRCRSWTAAGGAVYGTRLFMTPSNTQSTASPQFHPRSPCSTIRPPQHQGFEKRKEPPLNRNLG